MLITPRQLITTAPLISNANAELYAALFNNQIGLTLIEGFEMAALLANVCFECDAFRRLVEPIEEAQKHSYDGGPEYRGRGIIHLTHRYNYKEFGDAIGVDLVNHPDRAAEPEIAVEVACLFWDKKGCGIPARARDFEKVVRIINGGLNGLPQRLGYYRRALRAFGLQA